MVATVSIFSPRGEKLGTFGSRGSGQGEFHLPRGVAVDNNDNILVVDCDNHRIQKITSNGQFVKTVGKESSGHLQFFHLYGVAVHPHNKMVYVTDSENHCIQILNPDLTFSSTFGSSGSANGQLQFPYDVTFDNTWNVYIADSFNHRIQVFTAKGKFLRKFGQFSQSDVGQPIMKLPSSVYNHR